MAAPQMGLTSCQIGDMGYPRTVRGNSRHIPQEWGKILCIIYAYLTHRLSLHVP